MEFSAWYGGHHIEESSIPQELDKYCPFPLLPSFANLSKALALHTSGLKDTFEDRAQTEKATPVDESMSAPSSARSR